MQSKKRRKERKDNFLCAVALVVVLCWFLQSQLHAPTMEKNPAEEKHWCLQTQTADQPTQDRNFMQVLVTSAVYRGRCITESAAIFSFQI
ncbi:hypothetical protein BaRGS_00006288 [Batillaria attramentaria]|uniref:Secreted protein n=1 Tax=Batillaria attramentaria TaxID=370345 RepID=A0ABD0LST0_9CAEN